MILPEKHVWWMSLGLSVLVGMVTVYFASSWIRTALSPEATQVIGAAGPLEAGVKLTSEHVRMIPWPISVSRAGLPTDPTRVIGRVTAAPVVENEPIWEHRLAPDGSKAGLSGQIQPGFRAITVKVNEVMGVAGFALPGTYVDLLVNIPGGRNGTDHPTRSKIVLERVLVLAVAQENNLREEIKPRIVNAVTLLVTPKQSEQIDLARNIGNLSLILRNPGDTSAHESGGVVESDIFGTAAPPAQGRPRVDRRETIQVFRGSVITQMSIL
jgi:pilus assembly protein CpaB